MLKIYISIVSYQYGAWRKLLRPWLGVPGDRATEVSAQDAIETADDLLDEGKPLPDPAKRVPSTLPQVDSTSVAVPPSPA